MGCWRSCLWWGADLHIAPQMPLPLTISCSTKSRLVLTFLVLPFWYLLTRLVPDIFQKSSKTIVCVCYYTAADINSEMTVSVWPPPSYSGVVPQSRVGYVVIWFSFAFVNLDWLCKKIIACYKESHIFLYTTFDVFYFNALFSRVTCS